MDNRLKPLTRTVRSGDYEYTIRVTPTRPDWQELIPTKASFSVRMGDDIYDCTIKRTRP